MAEKSGRTTRRADIYIQKLFDQREIHPRDHTGSRKDDKELMFIILRRLKLEHMLRPGKELKVTQTTIKLEDNYETIRSDS